MFTVIRSIIFFIIGCIVTTIFGILVPLALLFGYNLGYDTAKLWGTTIVHLARLVCGLNYNVTGLENIPDYPCVSMAKHQSAWETVFILHLIPRAVWVIKRELVFVPFIGWALWGLRSIAIDRKSGKSAMSQIEEQGRDRINRGMWVSIFPEGTRVPPGSRKRYGIGGAWLAAKTGTPILPIAHNAGEYWGKNAFFKRPGTIQVRIGPLIQTKGREPSEVIAEVEQWIENEMVHITHQ